MLVKKMYGSWDDVDDYWINNNLIDCSKIKKLKKNNLQYNFNNNNVLQTRYINTGKYNNGEYNTGKYNNREYNIRKYKTRTKEYNNIGEYINRRNERFASSNEQNTNNKNTT